MKHFYSEKTVTKILIEFGTVLASEKEILSESFYANLIENKDHDFCKYNPSKISSLIGSQCLIEQESNERALTLDKISVALKSI